jgi:NAD(P)-dependent dehydrogenase (short-subunit alcohol dehydrogenase family)
MMGSPFDLTDRVAVITGGGGLLGRRHAAAIARHGGIPVLVDLRPEGAAECAREIASEYRVPALALPTDITDANAVRRLLSQVLSRFGRIDILVNNAANNPRVEDPGTADWSQVEHFPLSQWNEDITVTLTGSFLCCKVIGSEMARRGKGTIVNVASYLGIVAPEQRLYRKEGLREDQQPVKPISYTVAKSAIFGLTRYLAAYWGERGVRVNALSPGGVYNGQDEEFVKKLSQRIPMGRMAQPDEFEGAIVFLASDASSYMTGANLVVDGGRVCW